MDSPAHDIRTGKMVQGQIPGAFLQWLRRIFVRAQALGAWPTLRPIPTAVMEQPKADIPELEALPAEDWEIFLPALDKEMLRCVALLLADTRAAEMGRLNPKLITCDANGIPISGLLFRLCMPREKKAKRKAVILLWDPTSACCCTWPNRRVTNCFHGPWPKSWRQ